MKTTWTFSLAESTSVVMVPASVNRSITRSGRSVQSLFGEAPQLSFKSIQNKEKLPFFPCRDLFTHSVLVFFSRAFSFSWKWTKDWRVETSSHYVIRVFPDVWRKPSIRLLYMQFLTVKKLQPNTTCTPKEGLWPLRGPWRFVFNVHGQEMKVSRRSNNRSSVRDTLWM